MKKTFSIIIFICLGLYPILVFLGLNYFSPKFIVTILCFLVVGRYIVNSRVAQIKGKQGLIMLMATLLIAVFTFISNSIYGIKFYPVVISTVLLVFFGYSLLRPPSVIEQIARLQRPDLPPEGIVYTRKVTKIWALFFFLNGLVALYSCFFFTMQQWALYNGLISYIAMGCLFTAEFAYRKFIVLKGRP